jgi:putative ABC transport system permease protein
MTLKNLARRPIRTVFSLIGLAMSVAILSCLISFGQEYETSMHAEIDRMGMQMMIVPLGCPYDAAARVLKGRALDNSLPASALTEVLGDKDVAVAAPIFTAVVPRMDEGRTDLWVGIDQATLKLKPWWQLTPGSTWFRGPNSVILGSDAAATEMRKPGDKFLSPETGTEFVVAGVLTRSGTSDDSQFFVPLGTAQRMFHQPGRLTAIAIRLKDPAQVEKVSDQLEQVKGGQVVTLTEMMGAFLTLLGSARTLILAIALVAVVISSLTVFNTMMASVMERTQELGILRAVGMNRSTAFALMLLESLCLTLVGGLVGLLAAFEIGPVIQAQMQAYVPLAPESATATLTQNSIFECMAMVVAIGLVVGMFPAWRASRLAPAVALRLES